MIAVESCPCHSGKEYRHCCQPFHEGKIVPQTALQLMRSRYAAYACCLPKYILATTHPENPRQSDEKAILQFCRQTQFKGLSILDFKEETADRAYVTFRAELMCEGRDVSFTEKSLFLKKDQRWLYVSGEVKAKEAFRTPNASRSL